MRYGSLLQAKLPTFHNPNRVVHRMHNLMFHRHLLDIYTCHLTYRSFFRLAPYSCPKARCFQLVWTQINVYGHRFVGVISLGVVNKLLIAGEASDL
jgi:hypothetical protein